MHKKRKTACVGKACVACGNCIGGCPKQAITIRFGIRAAVEEARCVGCGKCVAMCPVQAITVVPQKQVRA